MLSKSCKPLGQLIFLLLQTIRDTLHKVHDAATETVAFVRSEIESIIASVKEIISEIIEYVRENFPLENSRGINRACQSFNNVSIPYQEPRLLGLFTNPNI